jgi:protein-tyrosine phosphatase
LLKEKKDMIDIHTHIIPNVDDGSKSLEISRELLNLELKNNVKNVFLTPHQNEKTLNKTLIMNKYLELKNNVKDIDINLYLGSEIYYYDNLSEDLKNNKIITMNNTKYLLIEFSTRYNVGVIDKLYDLKVLGYIPIVAHLERYPYLEPKDYDKIHNMGCMIQVNTKSFNEKIYKKTIKYLLKKNLIDFIGTDCHDLEKRNVEYDLDKIFKKHPQFLKKLEENETLLLV